MENRQVVVFDGVCNFCNDVVDFIIERDAGGRFAFASMQSEAGRQLIERCYGRAIEPDTFLLIREDACLDRTDAVLAIAGQLPWPWPLLRGFGILPRALRDFFYRRFASNRYRLFGRTAACRVPGRDVRGRFLG